MMGGFGSGRYSHYSYHPVVEGYRALDIAQFRRSGFPHGAVLSVTWSDGNSIQMAVNHDTVRLIYKYRQGGGRWQEVSEDVRLRYTCPYFGGRRAWFECPRCRRRARILYGADRLFLCRECYRLTYSSQREDRGERMRRRARKIWMRLGGDYDADPFPDKPVGMHWRTYDRLWDDAEALDRRMDAEMITDLLRLTARLERRR
jgi:hypothetical protein